MTEPGADGPVLRTYAYKDRWLIWCDHCATLHRHGAGPGHRTDHCREADSPYRETGYIVAPGALVVESRREARPGRAPLDGFLDRTRRGEVAARARLLKTWMPSGRRYKVDFPPGPVGSPRKFPTKAALRGRWSSIWRRSRGRSPGQPGKARAKVSTPWPRRCSASRRRAPRM